MITIYKNLFYGDIISNIYLYSAKKAAKVSVDGVKYQDWGGGFWVGVLEFVMLGCF